MVNLERFHAKSIASKADTESLDSYESNIEYFEREAYTYIPMPECDKYYDVDKEELREITREQYTHPDVSMITGFERLQEYPFLLFDSTVDFELLPGESDREMLPVEVGDESGSGQDDGELYILTLADANKRRARELFYHVLSEFESQLASLIKEHYPNSIIEDAKENEIERWYRAKQDRLEIHITEYMYLSTLIKVAGKNEEVRERLGYSRKNKLKDDLGGLNELRHSVMHPTRALIHDREDLETQVDRVERAQNVLEELDRGEIQPDYP